MVGKVPRYFPEIAHVVIRDESQGRKETSCWQAYPT